MKEQQFEEVASFIKIARSNTLKNINRALIELYWNIGGYIQEKITSSQWGQSVVEELGQYLYSKYPDLKGFSGSNLWRMRQFYSTYKSNEILAPLVREIGWTQNLSIMSRCKTEEERAFYLKISKENQYRKRELDRQISAGLFERVMIGGSNSPLR